MNPVNGSDCCALAASGHPVAALPKSVMKSRRLKDRPFTGELTIGGCLVQHSNPEPLMSALGQKLPRRGRVAMSALPPKAAATVTDRRVRFGAKSRPSAMQQKGRSSRGRS
jgi:hypothetical protein